MNLVKPITSSAVILTVSSVLFVSSYSNASCGALVAELRSMKEAQTAIQTSLVSNHDMFANTLESYSQALRESAGRAHQVVTLNMDKSAESFRERGLRAQKTTAKLEAATDDLIQRISRCLKQ